MGNKKFKTDKSWFKIKLLYLYKSFTVIVVPWSSLKWEIELCLCLIDTSMHIWYDFNVSRHKPLILSIPGLSVTTYTIYKPTPISLYSHNNPCSASSAAWYHLFSHYFILLGKYFVQKSFSLFIQIPAALNINVDFEL